jgi:hypothetical protein
MLGAGIKSSQFARIASIAGRLWIKMGSKNRSKLDLLKAQLRQYACNETPYNDTYVTNIDTPLRWWKTCGDETKHNPGVLSTLAIKLFSVRPHAASCERIWSCCGWFQGERRTQLKSSHLESMVKINSFLISNAKQELQYYGVDLTEEELLGVFQKAALVAETNEDLEEFVDLPDDSNIEYEDQQLLLDNLMDLTNPEFGNEDKDSTSEKNDENDENDDNDTDSNNEDNEFDEDEFGAAFVQSLQNE